ncbi:hypothetical protein GmHk_17G050027 [Glycine max]|nr:hypothetical protein GmHk_17G050027 [Glycine max]
MNKDESDRNEKKAQHIKLWGVFIFGLIGATVTAFSLSRLQSKGGSSFRTAFQEAWKRYNKRLQEEYEEEMERVERIRRMPCVIEETTRAGRKMVLVQHFQRDDWYWKAEASFREQWANHQHTQRGSGNCSLSHQYSVLGLDRTTPYTEAEIKLIQFGYVV